MKTLWKVLLGILGFCLVLGIVLYFLLRKHTSHTPATPTGCKIDNKCPHNLSCNGECQACSAIYQCPPGFDCEKGSCVKNTCDGPCPTGTFCYSGYCAPCTCAGIPCNVTPLPKSCGSEAGQSCGKIVDGACFEELQLDSSAYYTLEPTVCIDEKNYENLCRPAGIWEGLLEDSRIDSLKFGPNASWEFQINPNFCSKGDSKTPEDCENAQGKWHGPVLSAKIDNNGNLEDSPAAVQLHAKKIVSAINTWYSVNLIRVVALQYSETSKTGICSFSTTLKMDSVPSGTTASFPASQLTISYLQSDIGTEASQIPCNDNAAANYAITGEGEKFDSYLIGNMSYLTDNNTIPGRPYRCYSEPSPGCGGKENPFNQLTNKCYCNTCVAHPDNLCIASTCPVDCLYSDPTPWSVCKGPCAVPIDPLPEKYAKKTSTQTITQAAKNGGKCECDNGNRADCKVNDLLTSSKPCVIQPGDCDNKTDCEAANLFWITRAESGTPYTIPDKLTDGESSCAAPQPGGCLFTNYCSCTDDKYKEDGYTCNGIDDGRTPVPGGDDEDCWPTEKDGSGQQCCSIWGACPPGWPAGQPCCNNDSEPCPCPAGPDGETRRVRCGGNARNCGADCQNKCCSVTGPGPPKETPNPLCPKPYSAPSTKPYYFCDSGVPHYYFAEYDNDKDLLNSCARQCKKTEKPRKPAPGWCSKIT